MGVSLCVCAVGQVTDEQFQLLKDFIDQRFGPKEFPNIWERTDKGIEFWDGTRFYGIGYERGSWPHIYSLARIFRNFLPNCDIYLNEDHGLEGIGPDHEPITAQSLEETWIYWLSADGNGYWERRGF